jgi:hypothetical protein
MQNGLAGCGISLAYHVAQTGLGCELLAAVQTGATETKLRPFLQEWQSWLCKAFLALGCKLGD